MFCTNSHLSRISLVFDKSVTHFWIWFRNGALYLREMCFNGEDVNYDKPVGEQRAKYHEAVLCLTNL